MRADVVIESETVATIFCRDGEHALKLAQEKYDPQARIANLQSFCRRCEERRWVDPSELDEDQRCARCAELDPGDARVRLTARMIELNEEWRIQQSLTIGAMADALTAMGGDGAALLESFPTDTLAAMAWLVENDWYATRPRHMGSNVWTTVAEGNNGVAARSFQRHPARGWIVAVES